MNVRPLDPVLAEKALLELNEDPARVAADIQHLKEWIAKQPHLRARTDDQWLLSFLRGCKFSLERTKAKLDLYYTMRTTAQDITQAVKYTDPKFKEIVDLGINLLLPSAGPAEAQVVLFRFGAWDPSKYTIAEIMCVSFMLQKITIMENDIAIVAGLQSIVDTEGASASLLVQASTPGFMKKLMTLSQEASPFRIKGQHYINTPMGFETAYNFMKTFLNEKHRNRLYVHNKNFEEMHKIIPKRILPKEYGGTAGSLEDLKDHWRRKVEEYAEFFAQEEQLGTDEIKRPGKPRTSEEMFGFDGSFRKLQID